jgi:hypothetical protein
MEETQDFYVACGEGKTPKKAVEKAMEWWHEYDDQMRDEGKAVHVVSVQTQLIPAGDAWACTITAIFQVRPVQPDSPRQITQREG